MGTVLKASTYGFEIETQQELLSGMTSVTKEDQNTTVTDIVKGEFSNFLK